MSILGEKLAVMGLDGNDTYTSPGRPIASISNVMLEFRPGPAAKEGPGEEDPSEEAPAKKP